MDFVLIFLKSDEPPAAKTHSEEGDDAAKYHAR